jgi:hypothetical protein
MPDEEIAQYQLIDEHRASAEERGEEFNWEQARQLIQSS